MEQLKNIKRTLMNCVQTQLGDLKNTDTKELGEAIDMIKDISETMYYCSIVKAMEESEENKSRINYSYPPVMYDGSEMRTKYYRESYPRGWDLMKEGDYYPIDMRDYREGRSPLSRKMYMESKEMHHGKEKQMKELEEYMKELSADIMEMINDATPDEKAILSEKLTVLAEKVR